NPREVTLGRHRGSNAADNAPDTRRRANRRRRRRGTGRALAAFAAALAILIGLGVTGYFVLGGRLGCASSSLPLQVAAAPETAPAPAIPTGLAATGYLGRGGRLGGACSSLPLQGAAAPEIAPVLTRLADDFNSTDAAKNRCVTVEVRGADSADVAYSITGAGPTMGGTESQVWIPDSTLWVKTVQRDAADDVVVSTGTSVARSPLVLVTTETVAAEADASDTPLSWDNLVPTQALPDQDAPPYQVHVIDPVNSSSGLATLALVSNSVGTEEGSQTRFIAARSEERRVGKEGR